MKAIRDDLGVVGVELTRRNLRTLLAKLDGNPPDSECTLYKDGIFVRAVEDSAHYADRAPGAVHDETQKVLDFLADSAGD